MNWDDLRYFLAIARAPSLSAAGRDLGVSQPTVSRRLAAMESRLGVRLFDRSPDGHGLTAIGSEMFEQVARVEVELAAIDRRVFGQDSRLQGDLRLTCTEVLANLYLAPHLARFVARHPEIDLEVVCTFEHLSLSRREADVAIRVTARPPETLLGRRLAATAICAYAAPEAVARRGAAPWDWIGWRDATYTRMMITGVFPEARIRHRVDDMQTMCAMARAGLGAIVVPCYMADPDPGLVRIHGEPITQAGLDLWLLTHRDVKRVTRIRRFADFIAETILADRDLFEGRRPGAEP